MESWRMAGGAPKMIAVQHDAHSARYVTRFPYCVYYRADATRVEVVAIFHNSRDPTIWPGRA